MLVAGIKSRPEYRGLDIDPYARRHLFLLEGEGALALIERVGEHGACLPKAEILYLPAGSAGQDHVATLSTLGADILWTAPSLPPLLGRLRVCLDNANMGLRIYIAGTEGFIGQVIQIALEFGVDFNSLRTEHRGSLARRVQCVHCKGTTDNVTATPYVCSHCGLSLLVRDHYSRRLGAFQGVNVDAEQPGTAPQPEELFL
jgi:dimethylamine monooxygenase subunit C